MIQKKIVESPKKQVQALPNRGVPVPVFIAFLSVIINQSKKDIFNLFIFIQYSVAQKTGTGNADVAVPVPAFCFLPVFELSKIFFPFLTCPSGARQNNIKKMPDSSRCGSTLREADRHTECLRPEGRGKWEDRTMKRILAATTLAAVLLTSSAFAAPMYQRAKTGRIAVSSTAKAVHNSKATGVKARKIGVSSTAKVSRISKKTLAKGKRARISRKGAATHSMK
jgi:hypothetical protein